LKVRDKKAFLFVPIEIIITPQRARDSEIGFLFTSYPKLFKTHSRAADYILWVYITYELCKGSLSFFSPYFQAIGTPEMLMDWTTSEKSELQDKFLVFECKKQEKAALYYFESLSEVFSNGSFFPSEGLFDKFMWAFKMVTTRSFSHGEGMVIPFADNLNHDDVYVDYLTLSREFLLRKSEEDSLEDKDYKDYSGISHVSVAPMKFRSHLNRLEKYLKEKNEEVDLIRNVWEIDDVLVEYQSSSDEEEFVNDFNENSEEEEEEEDEDESVEEEKTETFDGKFFVMRTGSEGGFFAGSQVFNCYGRLNNTDLLTEYGFSLLPNRYDSLYVRVFSTQLVKLSKANNTVEIPKISINEMSRLKDFVKAYYLKYFKLNDKFFEYVRKVVLKNPRERFTVSGELTVITQAEQILLELKKCYPTSLQADEDLISLAPRIPIRTYFALSKK
jgi:hypothetical protein